MNPKHNRRLGMAICLALGLLATAGCERSQPGPKPISSEFGGQAGGSAPLSSVAGPQR